LALYPHAGDRYHACNQKIEGAIAMLSPLLRTALAFMVTTLLAGAAVAAEVDYPTQTVRLISAFAAGGGNDLMARELAQKFSEEWKKTAIVETKPGGNGDIATDYVARQPPDGHTLLVTTNATVVINPQLFKDVVRFDPVKDFAPVSLLARQPFVLVVNNKLPVKTVGELVAYIRAHPNKLNFGSSGAGGGAHLSGEMMKAFLGLKMTHVPYKGVAPALQDVISGHIDLMFGSIITAKPLVEGGLLRGLAVTSRERSPIMPNLPAMSEFPGLEKFEADLWYGLLAPANTDPAIVRKLYQSTVKAFSDPQLKARFEKTGTTLVGNSPAEFAAVIKSDLEKWDLVIKSANMSTSQQ
jgi:tripartite-type tricarboxylate transporter receptor subunit TctC